MRDHTRGERALLVPPMFLEGGVDSSNLKVSSCEPPLPRVVLTGDTAIMVRLLISLRSPYILISPTKKILKTVSERFTRKLRFGLVSVSQTDGVGPLLHPSTRTYGKTGQTGI